MNFLWRLEGPGYEVQHQRRIPKKQQVHGFRQFSFGENERLMEQRMAVSSHRITAVHKARIVR